MKTEFASPDRSSDHQLISEIEHTKDLGLVKELTQLISDAFVILNRHRQIVYANAILLDTLGIPDMSAIYGKRVGEAFQCIHSGKSEGGCGTTAYCRHCGAVKAILKSLDDKNRLTQEECRMVAGDEHLPFDLLIRAKTMDISGELFTLLIVRDIGNEKRKQVLERLFFHDIINTAGGIQGLIELMQDASEAELEEYITLAQTSSKNLIEEINSQKDLLAAENNHLEIELFSLNSMDILSSVLAVYKNHPVARGKFFQIDTQSVSESFTSDPRLLVRILGNMAKNALEAAKAGETVTIGATEKPDNICFWVHNSGQMPEEVRMQVFQRSFSTKGSGRGLGTYSIKLLGEKYLKGKVSFYSTLEKGTRFFLQLPLKKQASNP